jgi:hypothetical protein
MRLKLLTSADKIPTTTRNKRNSARYLIIETTFWNYSCWYGHLYRLKLKTTWTSEFFKDDRYCTSLKYECAIWKLWKIHECMFFQIALSRPYYYLLLSSFPVKWRNVIGREALSAVHYFPVM